MKFYAHSLKDRPIEEWEPLFTPFGEGEHECKKYPKCELCKTMHPKHGHLNKVAWWTAKFAEDMFPEGSEEAKLASEWGYLTGLWHDLGKFSKEFQQYLSGTEDVHSMEIVGKIDHTSAGAQHGTALYSILGHLLAFQISGHHSGLLNAISNNACLDARLKKKICSFKAAPSNLKEYAIPSLPEFLKEAFDQRNGYRMGSFIRFLFSCLVDADFLATESFMNINQSDLRSDWSPDILGKMKTALGEYIDLFGEPKTEVNKLRQEIYLNCVNAASIKPGFFSLTVPTGGGKTLSSLAFALKHAIKYQKKRIIYVIPFTSIIEQNAKVFRDVFSDICGDYFIEHHSNLDPEKETTASRLASENWDAPLVITTAVQFYESLHANKTSRSRKLHNIANSVVILDEAQSIPVDYLTPCLRVLKELVEVYSNTVVLCTATQPAINKSAEFSIGFNHVREIIPDTDSLFKKLKRVNVVNLGKLSDDKLTLSLRKYEQVLCVVNTRKHAQILVEQLSDKEHVFHLSALMCPIHRIEILDTVRQRLLEKQPVTLISTQLIEAGVDIDFPVVYRSLAGLDSIAQAAGRCNRNGKLEKLGKTYVFSSEHVSSEKYFSDTANVAAQVLDLTSDPIGTKAIQQYFDIYYYQQSSRWDSKRILDELKMGKTPELPFLFQYKAIAENFRFIENKQISVIIPFDSTGKKLCEQLRNPSIPIHRKLMRKLQRYTVQIYPHELQIHNHEFELVRDQFHVLICPELHYSMDCGLSLNEKYTNPKNLMC